jgi:PAS domain S-box-containing protein
VVITALRGPRGELRGYAKVTRDMTARYRERAQRALLAEAEKLAHAGSWEWDPSNGNFTWSDELYRIYGLAPDSVPPSLEAYLERVHPEDRPHSATAVTAALLEGRDFLIAERIVRADGEVRYLRSRGEILRDERGETLKVVCACRDVTQEHADQEALRGLSRRLVEAEETERRRLARELHDRVGQGLSALSINLDIVLQGKHSPEDRRRLQESLGLVEGTLQTIENVMAELRPPLLDEYGLAAALGGYAEEFCARSRIRVDVADAAEASRALSPDAALALFRIAQEALSNVAKHSGARHVDIRIARVPGGVELAVADDGCGFDPAAAATRGRWGMTTMRERAQAAGGEFSVSSAPREGTVVKVFLKA